jgi:hypothetical protein
MVLRRLRLLIIAIAASLSSAAWPARTAPEISDMWWNPDESGWGVNVIMQKDVAFATFFLYDTARNPTWYVAVLNLTGSSVWSLEWKSVRDDRSMVRRSVCRSPCHRTASRDGDVYFARTQSGDADLFG